jgi:hypothetical protein
MLVSKLVVFIVLHHNITKKLRTSNQVIACWQNCKENIVKVHYECWVFETNETVMKLVDEKYRRNHRPYKALVFEDMGFNNDSCKFNGGNTLFRYEFLERLIRGCRCSDISLSWLHWNANWQVADAKDIGINSKIGQKNMLREYFEDASCT